MKTQQTAVTFFSTSDLALAAALFSLGIPMTEEPVKTSNEDGIVYTFYVGGESEDGKYNTMEMVAAWVNPVWHDENPDHPLAYMKSAFENRNILLDIVKQCKHYVQVISKGKIKMIPYAASKEEVKKLLKI